MFEINLSKTKYCNAIQCKKMLWLDCYKPEEKSKLSNETVLDNGTAVGAVAKNLFGKHIDIEFNCNKNIMIKNTLNALKQENIVITEASFSYKENFCSIDILKKHGNDYETIEVKSSTEINDIYIDDVSYQYYVLKNLGYNVVKVSIAYINNKYVRYGDLNIQELFNVEDVTDLVINNFEKVEKNIKEINQYMENPELTKIDIGMHCFKPYDCLYFKYCTRHLPDNNIFNVRRMRKSSKMELYHKGIYNYDDLLKANINTKFKQQIDFELNNKKRLY